MRLRGRIAIGGVLATVAMGCSGSSEGDASSDPTSAAEAPATAAPTTMPAPPLSDPPPTTPTDAQTAGSDVAAPTSTTTAPVPPETVAAPPTDLEGVEIALTSIGEWTEPIAMTTRSSDPQTIYLATRGGSVRAINDEDAREVLDISGRTSAQGERGLLGIAASPDGERLYVSSTRSDDGASVIEEYRFTPDGGIDAETRREVITLEQPHANHNGGHLAFGPDGYLYVGFGDGGSADDPDRLALDPTTLLGKMLRIDPGTPSGELGYSVPADNPFVGDPAARPEIWASGLRNPWRYSFDRATGDLWIGDVGQGEWEEIDVVRAADGTGRGVSFGWSAFEGETRFNDDQSADGHVSPVHVYSHSSGDGNSVTGGFVYRGRALPELAGAYVFGDYESGRIWAISIGDAGGVVSGPVELADISALASFGEDADGELYVISLEGDVSRIDPA